MSAAEVTPIPAHVAGELYVWLWWASEQSGGAFDLPDPVGRITLWVDDRLAFRRPDDSKVTAVITGENPSTTLEARAALAGGKVLQELRIGLRRDDREFFVTLKGPAMGLGGLKVPAVLGDARTEAVQDRMFLYEELALVLSGLLAHFGALRTSPAWGREIVPAMRRWLVAEES